MMLAKLYAGAGFGHLSASRITLVLVAAVAGIGLSLVRVTGIAGIGIAGIALSVAAIIEGLRLLAQQREQVLVAALPPVIEGLAAGIASGEELGLALSQQAEHGPKALIKSMREFVRLGDQGWSLERSLQWLQVELSNVYADQLIQLLLVSLNSGGTGLVANLTHLSQVIRAQAALDTELAAKQGWVTGTAKLGLIAPWLIVMLLNARPEAHDFYASPQGLTLLVGGLLICLMAYLGILSAGKLPRSQRVFSDVH